MEGLRAMRRLAMVLAEDHLRETPASWEIPGWKLLKESAQSMLRLIAAALLASLILAACTAGQEPPTTAELTAAPQADRSERMQFQDTARQPEVATTPRPAERPATEPEPVVATESSPAPRLEPAATFTPLPTGVPTTGVPTTAPTEPGSTWRGITIAPEERCSPYDSDDYPYPPSVEPKIVEGLGGVYGPYTGNWFGSIRETDIEHIVARSEAHDSGLCAATPATRARFASDLLNLTLASPSVNRHQKVAKDAAEWLPEMNRCWYVDRTTLVRLEYGLTIDQAEADAIDRVLAGCESTRMMVLARGAATTLTAPATPASNPGVDALALWDDNGNGRITCAEARAHGIAPVRRGHPAYRYMNDADGDGMVCE